ncbi:response regulator transcription factor [Crocinitomix catalasitica]|uniref:response regulator transcription factor n=1 Tax=Crocinitomix catalasitica TaxID=184607 RepID=UPI0004820A18|nr:response regulator transcription factor [Crocinitomix catalasitica]
MEKLKILIADDHKLVRTGIKYTLTGTGDSNFIDRIDEVVNGAEAVERARIFDYDIILMDINMPEMDGIKATAEIVKDKANSKIIALSMHSDDYEIRSMIKAGAMGYLLKNTGSEVLTSAIKTVLEGGKYYSNEVALKLMEPYTGNLSQGKSDDIRVDNRKISLTRRELEVLKLIANEYTNEEIAKKFELSKRTIDSHRQNILSKLQVKNTAGLIKYAIRLGLV